MLTRAGVAKRIGRSIATVRRLEGSELFPTVGRDGVHRFDPSEVDAVLERRGTGSRLGPRGWLDSEIKRREGDACARGAFRQTAARRGAEKRIQATLEEIIERLSLAIDALTERELRGLPRELVDALSDVLALNPEGDGTS
jgi:hypothetical protein